MNRAQTSELNLLTQELIQNLTERHLTLSAAESCTGGLVSATLTAVPGSSAVFRGGVVAYDTSIKQTLLQIDPKLIEQYGVVSREVVREMAAGSRRIFRSDWAVATTGIAGPDGGTVQTPVGTIWMAIASPEGVDCFCKIFSGDRVQIQNAGVYSLLKALHGVFS